MSVDLRSLQTHYSNLSNEQLAQIASADLTPEAQTVFVAEAQRRFGVDWSQHLYSEKLATAAHAYEVRQRQHDSNMMLFIAGRKTVYKCTKCGARVDLLTIGLVISSCTCGAVFDPKQIRKIAASSRMGSQVVLACWGFFGGAFFSGVLLAFIDWFLLRNVTNRVVLNIVNILFGVLVLGCAVSIAFVLVRRYRLRWAVLQERLDRYNSPPSACIP